MQQEMYGHPVRIVRLPLCGYTAVDMSGWTLTNPYGQAAIRVYYSNQGALELLFECFLSGKVMTEEPPDDRRFPFV
jgi:hypothetical protein